MTDAPGTEKEHRAAAGAMPDSSTSPAWKDDAGLILSLLNDFLEAKNYEALHLYFRHVGFDVGALSLVQDLPAAWLGHYRLKQGVYDIDRAFRDLASYPPIAAEIIRQQQLAAESLA